MVLQLFEKFLVFTKSYFKDKVLEMVKISSDT